MSKLKGESLQKELATNYKQKPNDLMILHSFKLPVDIGWAIKYALDNVSKDLSEKYKISQTRIKHTLRIVPEKSHSEIIIESIFTDDKGDTYPFIYGQQIKGSLKEAMKSVGLECV